jgi:hypothetical protein
MHQYKAKFDHDSTNTTVQAYKITREADPRDPLVIRPLSIATILVISLIAHCLVKFVLTAR